MCRVLCRAALALFAAVLSLPARAAEVEFTRDVRPILSRHCFKCHGPDERTRKAKLRLDVRDAARTVLAPGKPDEGELLRRVFSTDAHEVMPPPSAKNPLPEASKQVLRQWIAAGAEYRPHWAFVPPRQQPLPNVQRTDWPRNAVDRFVLARLEAAGLAPSPEADRWALARRLHLDLVGLPPTPAEADAFVRDTSPDAYEKLVDRLLASPHYGERWARRWLDLARYADTNGYEKDRPRSIWPYRDWVINALNADLPFDRFTIEQLAGDLLPAATLEQRIATGFHRNTMLNEEGGIDPLEFRFHAMTDRVGTTGTVWLGLTLGCCQCHSHKFDPVSQREFYQLMAFLNNADEPELEVPRPEVVARRRELEAEIARLEAKLPERFPVLEGDGTDERPVEVRRREHLEREFTAWQKAEAARAVPWSPLRPLSARSNLPKLTVLDDASVLASGDQSKRDVYEVTFHTDLQGLTALRLEVLPHESLPKRGPGRVWYEGPPGDFLLSELTLEADGRPVELARASHTFANGTQNSEAAIDRNPHTGWSINGGQGRAHLAVFNLAEPLPGAKVLTLRMVFEKYYSAGLGRFRVSATTHADADARLPGEIEEVLLVPPGRRTVVERDRLWRHFLSVVPELAPAHAEIKKLTDQLPAYPTTLVMQERPADHLRPTHLHHRGEYLEPRERIEPDVLSVLPALPKDALANRLTFARWLVDPGNPLVGRVTVNRHWAVFFGRGLVRTAEDFGITGEPPTHPELLDWLAVELVRQGWSIKQLHRLIVTSATYRQTSRVTPELLKSDPENRLLARGPRFRLDAELLRDAALLSSGLLSPKVGGPSVFPPQPPGITSEGAYGKLDWKVSPGADRYRRGLYTFSKRTAPYAMFSTFDGPSGEACLARREVSNTPLQALTLLNDAVFVEAAQGLGRLAAVGGGAVEERLTLLFRRCLTRPPDRAELAVLVRFYHEQRDRFERKELDPVAVAGSGALAEQAAWTAVARALLNLDETITRN